MPIGPARDLELDRALVDVRRRHRQVQSGKSRSVKALREAKRSRAVTKAERLAFDYAEPISDHVTDRPEFGEWLDSVLACANAWPDDKRLQKDLRAIGWTPSPHLTIEELRILVTEAAIEHSEVVAKTRSPGSGPRQGERRTKTPRHVKKQERRDAERRLHAALASLSSAVTSVINSDSGHLQRVASGSLRRR